MDAQSQSAAQFEDDPIRAQSTTRATTAFKIAIS
jgi:hypothetical protein